MSNCQDVIRHDKGNLSWVYPAFHPMTAGTSTPTHHQDQQYSQNCVHKGLERQRCRTRCTLWIQSPGRTKLYLLEHDSHCVSPDPGAPLQKRSRRERGRGR
ncbi:hypothetical protein AOLI_G00124240 [Acnodon oligacanthus]